MRSRQRAFGLPAKLLLAAASVLGTIFGLEWGARWLGLYSGFFLLPRGGNCLERSATLSLQFRSNCVGEMSETHFATNALGFRGPALRGDGSVRILALGDSCTWGWQVGQDESYPVVLQQLLDQQFGASRYQVLNAGVPGYTSYQVLVTLREKGLPLHPAIAIIGVGFNDLSETGDVEQQIAAERRLMPLLLLDDALLDRSVLYRWARWTAAGGARPRRGVRVTPERYEQNLRAMIELARANGVQVVLLSFWGVPRYHLLYTRALSRAAESLDVPLLAVQGPRFDIVHPTVAGDRILAEDIFRTLRAMHWVGSAGECRDPARVDFLDAWREASSGAH